MRVTIIIYSPFSPNPLSSLSGSGVTIIIYDGEIMTVVQYMVHDVVRPSYWISYCISI